MAVRSRSGLIGATILIVVALVCQPAAVSSYHALVGNCPGADPDDDIPDDDAINACLSQGGDVILEEGTMGYLILYGLQITVPGTRLVGAGNGAVLLSMWGRNDYMLAARWVDGFLLENLRFYGNKEERAGRLWQCSGERTFGKNLLLQGDDFVVSNIVSMGALCGSAAEVEGSGFEIRDSLFAYNGYESGGPEPWADGLTVWRCTNGSIHDNEFRENTDVDLVVGGGSGCAVERNTITHAYTYGFAGIHIGWFPGGGGNHQGNEYRFNEVNSAYNRLAFGIVVGFHPWDASQPVSHAGTTMVNSSFGSVVNLAVDGIEDGEVQSNEYGNARGDRGMGCSLSADYTVSPAEYGYASLQSGWIPRWYHNGVCGS